MSWLIQVLFKIDNLPEYIFRLVYILIFAYALAGVFLHAAQKSDEKVDDKSLVSPFLGFTESTIVLGSVAALFLVFVVIQFQLLLVQQQLEFIVVQLLIQFEFK